MPATTAATFDNATRTLAWSEGTGVAPDFVRAGLRISHETPSPYDIEWEIVAPYTAGAVTWPTLPAEVLDYNIGSTDPVSVEGVALVKVPGGYDAGRPVIYTLESPEAIAQSGSGSAQVEFIYPQQQLRTAKPAQKRGHSTWQTKRRM